MTPNRHTIRNIDPDTLLEARVFSVQNQQTLGDTVTEALEYYFSNMETEDNDAGEEAV